MGRRMPPRVTYWTGTWDPAKEAISKEITALRTGSRAHAPVVAFSRGQGNRLYPGERVLTLSDGAWPVLRAAAALLERMGDVTHVFGGRGISWHKLRALGRRPVVLTAVTANTEPDGGLPETPIAKVVVEVQGAEAEWINAGIPRDRIERVAPGIDLTWYRPSPPPAGRFTLLFASTPSEPSEIDARGIPLLVELARARPGVDLLLPWRTWGDVAEARSALEALNPPPNFHVEFGNIDDMRALYARAHATVICFEAGAGKSSPNFVLEGLAAGRPCIAAAGGGVAPDIAQSGAGLVVAREVSALADAVDRIQADWSGFSLRARALAQDRFDMRAFLAAYERIYKEVAESRG